MEVTEKNARHIKRGKSQLWGGYLPFDYWRAEPCNQELFPCGVPEREWVSRYLLEAEQLAEQSGMQGFGFKLLSHHLDERGSLLEVLRERTYRAIYLTRNVPRQVISGMIAGKRGKYNSTQLEPEDRSRHPIDLEKFKTLVRWELACVDSDIQRMKDNGFETCVVTYEDFCADRQAFFRQFFEFLGLSPENLDESDFKVMIKDVAHTVENYDEVVECVRSMGLELKA